MKELLIFAKYQEKYKKAKTKKEAKSILQEFIDEIMFNHPVLGKDYYSGKMKVMEGKVNEKLL
jgi:hypothetical protein